jgi:transcriptional regulator
MKEKPDVLQGTLALMVLKTLDVLGPQHGYGIARRIEQISGDILALNQGTLYPLLLKLEHEGSISSQWGASENNRRTRFYRLRTCLKTEFKGGRLRFVASHPFAKNANGWGTMRLCRVRGGQIRVFRQVLSTTVVFRSIFWGRPKARA